MPLSLALELSLPALSGGGGAIIPLSNIAAQSGPLGRGGTFNNTTQQTMQVTAEAQVRSFTRMKVVIANTLNAGRGVLGCSVAVLPNLSDPNGASATHVLAKFSASNTVVLAATDGGTNEVAYTITDWIDIASIARDDDGDWPVVLARVYEGSSASIGVLGNGTDSFTNWASRTDGHAWIMRRNAGNCCQTTGTPANFVSTTAVSQTSIAGFIFETPEGSRVCTIAGIGDSITEGRGTYLGEGFAIPMLDLLNAAHPGVTFTWWNGGWSSSTMASFVERQENIVDADLPIDIFMFPNASPNNIATTIGSGTIDGLRTFRDQLLAGAVAAEAKPLVWTWLPTNPAVKDYGSTDSLRVDYNEETIADGATDNYVVADFSTLMTGALDGDGQYAMTGTTDGIHPNDAGNATLAAAGVAGVERVVYGRVFA